MNKTERKPITCRNCGKQNTCTCAFDVKSIDWKTREGLCKKCAALPAITGNAPANNPAIRQKESTTTMGINPKRAELMAKAEAEKPLLSHCGYSNPENNAILQKLARSFGCRYHWDGLKDNVHHTAERHKRAAMVAIWNGHQFTTPLVAKLCKKRGIPHFFFEQGMLPQSKTFFVDPQGFCGDSVLNGDLSWVTEADMERLYARRAELQKQYPRNDEGFILAPLQIHNDSQILFYSHYRNMDEFVADVETLYPDQRIIARPHPKGGKKHAFARAEEIFEGDYLSWAARASRVVGITSTCLYEAAVLGVPVQALGDHPFKTHPPELHDKVAAGALALCIPRNGDMRNVLDRFGYAPLVREGTPVPFTPSHLGGHQNKTHLDEGALRCIIKTYGIKSFLDVGCGPGGMLDVARGMGLRTMGIDGDPAVAGDGVLTHDFTQGGAPLSGSFDLAWSTEFLEHVGEQFQPYYMAAFQRAKYVFVTAAPPGKKGHHHVNCKDAEYWKVVFTKYGFQYDEDATLKIKAASTMRREFVRNTGMFFVNQGQAESPV